ncbi:MAG: alpha-galactosidase [Spirochaetales bacterium]|nr:alpha-galactosidase [Spirochaetales bacterium]
MADGTWILEHKSGDFQVFFNYKPETGDNMTGSERWQLESNFSEEESGWYRFSTKLTNRSSEAAAPGRIFPLKNLKVTFSRPLPLQHCQKKNMAEISRFRRIDENVTSHMLSAWTDESGDRAFLAGWEDLSRMFTGFDIRPSDEQSLSMDCWADLETMTLQPGECLQLPDLLFSAGEKLSSLMTEYARKTAALMGNRGSRVPSGWCSWYYYLDTLKAEDIRSNMKALKNRGFQKDVDVIQIDDGWNLPEKGAEKVWGDWDRSGALFPEGMEQAARSIEEEGFTPGLWLAPFAVAPASRLFREHPDWCIQKNGKPAVIYGIHALDLSHPEVPGFLRKTFRRVFREWGFNYVKLDFLHFAIEPGERYNPERTTAELIRTSMEIIREEAGDERFILGCGAPFAPLVGLVDGMRTGHDVSCRWSLGPDPEEPEGPYISVGVAAWQTVRHQWMHRNWWANDPDCLLTRDYASEAEAGLFEKVLTQFKDTTPYGLSEEEARCWVELIRTLGVMPIISENMEELDEPRCEILRKAFQSPDGRLRQIDWYEERSCHIYLTESDSPRLALFNFADEKRNIRLPASKLQGFRVKEGITEKDGRLHFDPLPAHSFREITLEKCK